MEGEPQRNPIKYVFDQPRGCYSKEVINFDSMVEFINFTTEHEYNAYRLHDPRCCAPPVFFVDIVDSFQHDHSTTRGSSKIVREYVDHSTWKWMRSGFAQFNWCCDCADSKVHPAIRLMEEKVRQLAIIYCWGCAARRSESIKHHLKGCRDSWKNKVCYFYDQAREMVVSEQNANPSFLPNIDCVKLITIAELLRDKI
jgi:hypothetical protein